ncbi:hypothetical protein [Bradyrhizobium betae]|nr:hypothetical protein [Bradyrhizobium betae]MCS3731499.1 hypothetical protein [Bradyrhizobium betae]
MNALTDCREEPGYRVLRQQVDLEVGVQLAQFTGNRDVASPVPKAYRGG